MTERDRMLLRRRHGRFIFQSFGLIPMLSAAENIGIPLRIAGAEPREREERVQLHAGHRRPGRPRRPAARTSCPAASSSASPSPGRSAASPELLIADEPTGQLDSETGAQIMRLLRDRGPVRGHHRAGRHARRALLELADNVLRLEDGRLADAQ